MADDTKQSTSNDSLQQQIDRLVDGELNQAEQQQLLRQLEQQPDGWRNCALSFVEAQVWSSELASLPPSSKKSHSVVSRNESDGRLLKWAGSMLLATAAGALLALGIAHFVEPTQRPSDGPAVATEEDRPPSSAGNGQRLVVNEDSSQPIPVGDATFFVTTGDQEQAIELPVYAASDLSDDWQTDGTELPVEFVEALNRTGRTWKRSRELIPVQLEEGGHVIVPVNQISFESPVVYQ